MCSAQAKINKISYCSQSKRAPAAPTFQTLLSPHLPVRRCSTTLKPRCCIWKLQLLRSLTQQLSPRLALLSYVTTALHRRNNYHRRPTITQAMDVVCVMDSVQSLAVGGSVSVTSQSQSSGTHAVDIIQKCLGGSTGHPMVTRAMTHNNGQDCPMTGPWTVNGVDHNWCI